MARICPSCRGEFRDEIVSCPDCGIELVAEWALPPASEQQRRHEGASITVFATSDLSRLALAKALLEEAEIPFAVWNERMIELFPDSRTGPTYDREHLQAELQVLEPYAEQARNVLAQLETQS